MTPNNKPPKAFISYSWSNPQHESWVLMLAERLMRDGVEVIIDKWSVKPGQDLNHFMESMVTSPDIDRVLIVCDKKYASKADDRKGGVGTETQIISPKIYKDTSQEKFIPLYREVDNETGEFHKPTYMSGRLGIDFSKIEFFEESYEQLLRNIFQRPSITKPTIGTPPAYLFADPIERSQTSLLLQRIDTVIENRPEKVYSLLRDFLSDFFSQLSSLTANYNHNDSNGEICKKIYDSVLAFTPTRNDLISFIDKITKNNTNYNIDILIDFFEKLLSLPDHTHKTDHYKFLIHEIFLLLISILIKNENYEQVSTLFYSTYYKRDGYSTSEKSFEEFRQYSLGVEEHIQNTNNQRYYSGEAEAILTRIPAELTKDDIVNNDLLCYYISQLKKTKDDWWFPICLVYRNRHTHREFYDKLKSKRFFNKVKYLFDVESSIELSNKILDMKQSSDNHNGWHYPNSGEIAVPLYKLIDPTTIASQR